MDAIQYAYTIKSRKRKAFSVNFSDFLLKNCNILKCLQNIASKLDNKNTFCVFEPIY